MAAFCLLAVFQVAAAGKELIPAPYQSVIAHADAVYAMNGNEHRVRFCILGDAGASHGRAIAAYRLGPNGEPRRIYLDRDRGCCPWKILVCELDGDPEPEIAVGMYKATRFFPEPANRLFIFDWNGRFIFPKWLGSRLTSPLEDFAFIRGEACRSRLAALEQTKGENYVLRIYDWCGFGFAGDSDPLKPNSREEGLEILRALQSGASWEEATGRRGK